MSSGNNTRAIERGFKRRTREFENRVRDPEAEATTRQRLRLPDLIAPVTVEEQRENALRSIRAEPNIGHLISKFMPEASDRAGLNPSGGGAFVNPENRDRICLPIGNTFRTNPDPNFGCGPHTSLDDTVTILPGGAQVAATQCCVQTDVNFCAKVAAIMYSAGLDFGGRVVAEIASWLQEYRMGLVDNMYGNGVDIDTSNDDGKKIQTLAILTQTGVDLNIGVNDPNEDLANGLINVRSAISVRALTNGGSVSFRSVERIVTQTGMRERLVIHCPVDMTGLDVVDVVDMINNSGYNDNSVLHLNGVQ